MANLVKVVNEVVGIRERVVAKLERNKTKVSILAIILLCGLFIITHLVDIVELNKVKLVNEAFYFFLTSIIGYYAIIKIVRITIIQS